LGLIIVFGMIRPSIKLMKEPPPAPPAPEPLPQLEATVADENERPELSPGMTLEDGSTTEGAIGSDGLPIADKPLELTAEQKRLEAAKQLALENPLAVANIIKAWVNGE
jgi:flagellar M-ring protein FliF